VRIRERGSGGLPGLLAKSSDAGAVTSHQNMRFRLAGSPAEHLPMLDGLRGLAILMVLAHNLLVLEPAAGLVARRIEQALNLGWIGVTLFFALSGYLITRSLLLSSDSPSYFRDFFARRILRIFPLYYATLFFLLVVLPALVDLPPEFTVDLRHQVWLWVFLSNWTTPFYGSALPHFWSLAIEEQFYAVWPFLLRRRRPAQVFRLCLVLALASFLVRLAMLLGGADPEAVYMFTFARMDALALGAALAALVSMPDRFERIVAMRGRLLAAAAGLWLLGVVITHGYPRTLPLGQTVGYSLLAITFAMVILCAICAEPSGTPRVMRLLRARPLRILGKYSYGMYVFHKPIHDLVGRPLMASLGHAPTESVGPALAYLAAAGLVTFVAAAVSFHALELPFLRLKRHFGTGRIAQGAAAG
jgi:peptidoglycan/LPS O-acetylase OafA/YrhL